jgi:hypothetical protein
MTFFGGQLRGDRMQSHYAIRPIANPLPTVRHDN